MIGLTMQLGLATPLAFMAPHPAPIAPPPPVVAASPAPPAMTGALPPQPSAVVGGTGLTAPTPPRVTTGSAATTAPSTTSTTVYSGLECVVTITGSDGTTMTYSPGPAVEGQCSQGVPEPVTSTW